MIQKGATSIELQTLCIHENNQSTWFFPKLWITEHQNVLHIFICGLRAGLISLLLPAGLSFTATDGLLVCYREDTAGRAIWGTWAKLALVTSGQWPESEGCSCSNLSLRPRCNCINDWNAEHLNWTFFFLFDPKLKLVSGISPTYKL